MTRSILIAVLFCLPGWLHSQDGEFIYIHQEQNEYYARFAGQDAVFFDSLNGFSGKMAREVLDTCHLEKLVFGFHPYWIGSAYLNYHWDLLSDLCYFSYEVDPATGDPLTIHDWLTDPAIDSAQARGVRTHLCVTLFSGHYTFFGDPTAQQNLTGNLISLVQQRNAEGINIDFEAVPSSLREEVTTFMISLSDQFHSVMPDGILSIDLPAVDWGDVFDVLTLKDHVDLFFVMGYDYYWNGSGTAGPVGPLYAMTDIYDYSLCRTISSYQSKGMPDDKFILGLPYYGRVWKTLSNSVPSATIGYGTALTYANVRNNAGGNFSPEKYSWEGNSFSSCYIYYENDDWNQCFIGLEKDLKKRYDQVNYRGLAGIGIWALGYDNGYVELWDAIRSRFTDCRGSVQSDTIYDCGGPAWDYYNTEDYRLTLDPYAEGARQLEFRSFSTEEGYDSLYIYSGSGNTLNLLGAHSGNTLPPFYTSGEGIFTLHFHSDGLTTAEGWEAILHDGTLGTSNAMTREADLFAYPNPFRDRVRIYLEGEDLHEISVQCTDAFGREVALDDQPIEYIRPGLAGVTISVKDAGAMTYILKAYSRGGTVGSLKLIHLP